MRVVTVALPTMLCAVLALTSSAVGAVSGTVDTAASADQTAERQERPADPIVAVGREVRLECSWRVDTVLDMPATSVTRIGSGNTTAVFTGYSELAGGGRTATLMAIENGEQVWCSDELAISNEPTAGTGVVWDLADRLLIVVVANADITGDLAEAAQDGWLDNHSDRNVGGAPAKSVILATVDPSTGEPIDATFITTRRRRPAQPADLVLDDVVFEGGGYRVDTLSAEPPRRRDGSSFTCPAASEYAGVYVFPSDFSKPVVAAAPGCS